MDFVVTGTQVYGPVNSASDLDIVLLKEDAKKIEKMLDEHYIYPFYTTEQEMYDDGGFNFMLGGIKVNIITAKDMEELNLWRRRTNRMKRMPSVRDKESRIKIFNEGN